MDFWLLQGIPASSFCEAITNTSEGSRGKGSQPFHGHRSNCWFWIRHCPTKSSSNWQLHARWEITQGKFDSSSTDPTIPSCSIKVVGDVTVSVWYFGGILWRHTLYYCRKLVRVPGPMMKGCIYCRFIKCCGGIHPKKGHPDPWTCAPPTSPPSRCQDYSDHHFPTWPRHQFGGGPQHTIHLDIISSCWSPSILRFLGKQPSWIGEHPEITSVSIMIPNGKHLHMEITIFTGGNSLFLWPWFP